MLKPVASMGISIKMLKKIDQIIVNISIFHCFRNDNVKSLSLSECEKAVQPNFYYKNNIGCVAQILINDKQRLNVFRFQIVSNKYLSISISN